MMNLLVRGIQHSNGTWEKKKLHRLVFMEERPLLVTSQSSKFWSVFSSIDHHFLLVLVLFVLALIVLVMALIGRARAGREEIAMAAAVVVAIGGDKEQQKKWRKAWSKMSTSQLNAKQTPSKMCPDIVMPANLFPFAIIDSDVSREGTRLESF
jgi:hypothetical protein